MKVKMTKTITLLILLTLSLATVAQTQSDLTTGTPIDLLETLEEILERLGLLEDYVFELHPIAGDATLYWEWRAGEGNKAWSEFTPYKPYREETEPMQAYEVRVVDRNDSHYFYATELYVDGEQVPLEPTKPNYTPTIIAGVLGIAIGALFMALI